MAGSQLTLDAFGYFIVGAGMHSAAFARETTLPIQIPKLAGALRVCFIVAKVVTHH